MQSNSAIPISSDAWTALMLTHLGTDKLSQMKTDWVLKSPIQDNRCKELVTLYFVSSFLKPKSDFGITALLFDLSILKLMAELNLNCVEINN